MVEWLVTDELEVEAVGVHAGLNTFGCVVILD